jgi:hypothetical protein
MGRYNSNKLSTKFVENYINNRFWERNNSQYVPLLSVRSVPTKGKANRVIGCKTGREHHFLSKLEYAAFYNFDWSNKVIDIKEQYPLLPIDVLQNIAMEAGIEYPNFNGEPIIMTTDFLITTNNNGSINQYARTVKPSTELSNPRIIEKFEIERRYFASKNIDWAIITEKELPDIFTTNMDILHSNKLNDNQTSLEKQYLVTLYKELVITIEKISNKNMPVAYMLTQLSDTLNMTLSDISEVFFKSIIDKVLVVDVYNKPLNITTLILSDININTELLLKAVNTIKGGIL